MGGAAAGQGRPSRPARLVWAAVAGGKVRGRGPAHGRGQRDLHPLRAAAAGAVHRDVRARAPARLAVPGVGSGGGGRDRVVDAAAPAAGQVRVQLPALRGAIGHHDRHHVGRRDAARRGQLGRLPQLRHAVAACGLGHGHHPDRDHRRRGRGRVRPVRAVPAADARRDLAPAVRWHRGGHRAGRLQRTARRPVSRGRPARAGRHARAVPQRVQGRAGHRGRAGPGRGARDGEVAGGHPRPTRSPTGRRWRSCPGSSSASCWSGWPCRTCPAGFSTRARSPRCRATGPRRPASWPRIRRATRRSWCPRTRTASTCGEIRSTTRWRRWAPHRGWRRGWCPTAARDRSSCSRRRRTPSSPASRYPAWAPTWSGPASATSSSGTTWTGCRSATPRRRWCTRRSRCPGLPGSPRSEPSRSTRCPGPASRSARSAPCRSARPCWSTADRTRCFSSPGRTCSDRASRPSSPGTRCRALPPAGRPGGRSPTGCDAPTRRSASSTPTSPTPTRPPRTIRWTTSSAGRAGRRASSCRYPRPDTRRWPSCPAPRR